MYEPFNRRQYKKGRVLGALKKAALVPLAILSIYAMDKLSCYKTNDILKVSDAMIEKAQKENITPQEAYKKLNIEEILNK